MKAAYIDLKGSRIFPKKRIKITKLIKELSNGCVFFLKLTFLKKIKKLRPLYYIYYRKEETKQFLKDKFDWVWYGGQEKIAA